MLNGRRIVLGITGGIAAYKACELARRLVEAGASVSVVMTEAAGHFITPMTLQALTGNDVATGLFDLDRESRMSHIRLAREADLILIAPASANFIGRMALGLANDLLSTLVLAARCPIVVAPAMNTAMFEHPATQRNLDTLAALPNHSIVPPGSGSLACGEVGPGRLADPENILERVHSALEPGDLADIPILITAGPTREPIDAVRFISNPSSGKMGYALAENAVTRGARVTLISGPVALPTPAGVELVAVESARQMYDAVLSRADQAQVIIKAAAVCDIRPAKPSRGKTPKQELTLNLALERNDDILATLGQRGTKALLVGFAAESGETAERRGREKLTRKGCNLLVINRIDQADAGFGADTNRALLLSPDGLEERVPEADSPAISKHALARRILDRVLTLLHKDS